MVIVPEWTISLWTLPGTICHVMARQLCCRLLGIAILDVSYVEPGSFKGHLIHEKPRKAYQQFLITLAPLFFNTLLGSIIAFSSILPTLQFDAPSPLEIVLIWLGLSIVMHSFPTRAEAKELRTVCAPRSAPGAYKVIYWPVAAFLWVGAAIDAIFWLNVSYSLVVIATAPALVLYL